MIRKVGNKYVLYTADGSRRLGTHATRAEAAAQEAAIKASEARAKKRKK